MSRIAQVTHVGVLLLFVLAPEPATAQMDCPFADSMAVADTLDPSGYFPLQVGNVWEYIVDNSGFIEGLLREEIVADTLIDGTTFFKRRQIWFEYDPYGPPSQLITDIAFERFFYFFIIDRGEVFWREQGLDTTAVKFDHPFNSCYNDLVVVGGGYGESFEIQENGVTVSRALPAIKTFESTFTGSSFGYGIGRIATFGDPSVVTRLSYARVNGLEFGTPLDSLFTIVVSAEEKPLIFRQHPRLQNYPNPFQTTTQFVFSLSQPARVTVQIRDLLGRLVAQPLVEAPHAAGEHVITWNARGLASGVCWARLVTDDGRVAHTKMVHVN